MAPDETDPMKCLRPPHEHGEHGFLGWVLMQLGYEVVALLEEFIWYLKLVEENRVLNENVQRIIL
ncbi:hypothetical protein FRX31_013137 [Thalictrum thalictroides]|uniref:Uncharacterized protein n=1 Tax=Thalictrum thalictroides TaxID=46969 RepID=A0A7J6WJZ2_THATH|nr:hypothetical protein FRX31_013137 [Thalictrum thalictroides]